MRGRSCLIQVFFLLLLCTSFNSMAMAQVPASTSLEQARTHSRNGRRAEALALLNTHLATAPQDSDARTLRATILSWEGRYDDARKDLELVLAAYPGHADALPVLARVELWSGHPEAAEAIAARGLSAHPALVDLMEIRALALEQLGRFSEARGQIEQLIAADPGTATGRRIRRRLLDREPGWSGGLQYRHDRFDDDREAWHETQASVSRQGGAGSIGIRAYDARRFGLTDQLFELEAYPRFGNRTYVFAAVAWSPDAELYPERRYVADVYQAVGASWELSAGIRLLDFRGATQLVDVYTAGVQRYGGSWLFGVRGWFTPDQTTDALTIDGLLRRYRADGVSYLGMRGSRGRYRDDERTTAGLADLFSVFGAIELSQRTGRAEWSANAGVRRQDLAAGSGHLWQATAGVGLRVRF